MSAKYACIEQHRRQFPVTLMCRVLTVSTTGNYAARQRPRSARQVRDEQLRVAVRTTHAASRRRYGAPRVQAELQAQGEVAGRKRAARLMREDGLAARPRRRFIRTTDSAHTAPVAANLVAQQLDVAGIGGVDRVWRPTSRTFRRARDGRIWLSSWTVKRLPNLPGIRPFKVPTWW